MAGAKFGFRGGDDAATALQLGVWFLAGLEQGPAARARPAAHMLVKRTLARIPRPAPEQTTGRISAGSVGRGSVTQVCECGGLPVRPRRN